MFNGSEDVIQGGMGALLDSVVKTIGTVHVHLDSIVKEVNYDEEIVEVVTQDS